MSLADEDIPRDEVATPPAPAPARAVAAAPATSAAPAAATPSPAAAPEAPAARSKRKVALLGVSALVLLCGIGYGIYWMLVLNHFESTDNAYVQGNVVQVTPQVAGTVVAINADDTDFVKAGQSLVKLDKAARSTSTTARSRHRSRRARPTSPVRRAKCSVRRTT